MTATEQYGYDELQRLLSASRSWTGMTPSPATSLGDTYAYDDLGNITKKSDYADAYTYGNTARTVGLAGPHAVASVSVGGVPKASFAYDANGNLVSGDGRTITFDNLDRPVAVTMAGYTVQFRYAPDGSRYLQSNTGIPSSQEYYFEKLYELVESAQTPTDRTYVNNAVMIVRTGSVRAVRYRHLDRLGSLDAVTKEDASEDPVDAHGYDAFGKPRARDWQSSSDQLQPNSGSYTTERGFTGHEHLDTLYLIHMNGRVYDYRLGRFLSVDPIISNPANSQSINPYSYIGNNPLSGVDPTGYVAEYTMPDCKFQTCQSIVYNSAMPQNQAAASSKNGMEGQGTATPAPSTPDRNNPTATAQNPAVPKSGPPLLPSLLARLAPEVAVGGTGETFVVIPKTDFARLAGQGAIIVGIAAAYYRVMLSFEEANINAAVEMEARYGGSAVPTAGPTPTSSGGGHPGARSAGGVPAETDTDVANARTAVAGGSLAAASLQANRAAGNAFRDEIAQVLQSSGRDVQTEVYKSTPFGKRFIDIEVSQNGKVLGGVETKLNSSPYTPAQRAKDTWLWYIEGYRVNVVRGP